MLVYPGPSGIALEQRWVTMEQALEGQVESGQLVLGNQWVETVYGEGVSTRKEMGQETSKGVC